MSEENKEPIVEPSMEEKDLTINKEPEEKKYGDKEMNDLLTARVTKELEKARAELYKKAGVADEAGLEALKQLQESTLTETEKTAKELEEKTKELAELQAKAELAETKAEALALGVDPSRIDRVVKIVQGYDGETVSDKVKAFIAENPEFVKKAGIQNLGTPSGGDNLSEEERLLAIARRGAGLTAPSK